MALSDLCCAISCLYALGISLDVALVPSPSTTPVSGTIAMKSLSLGTVGRYQVLPEDRYLVTEESCQSSFGGNTLGYARSESIGWPL